MAQYVVEPFLLILRDLLNLNLNQKQEILNNQRILVEQLRNAPVQGDLRQRIHERLNASDEALEIIDINIGNLQYFIR